MQLQLPIHSYRLRSRPASSARIVNAYAEALPPDAKTPVLLTRSPGITEWTTVGTGPIGPMIKMGNFIFVVSGSQLYSVTENKTAALLGTTGTQGNMDIEQNGQSVVVVNQPNAYVWTPSSAMFQQITDPDFTNRGASDVEFLDNWLLFVDPGTGVFFAADLGTATSFSALNFATAEGAPDNLIGLKVDHRQAILFGEETTEIWDNTGIPGFPFERAPNGLLEIGTLNGRTCAKQDNSVFWLANDYTVRRLDAATPIRVSTHAIEQTLGGMSISTGKAWTYSQEGHLFYVLSFFEGTFVYDATTQEWHERQTYGRNDWIAGSHAQAFGLELVGDATSNKIGFLSGTDYDEFSATQRMEWTYQPVYAEGARAFHDRLEIVLETGVGLTTGQGVDPEMMLEVSDNGGITWRSFPNKKIGPIGQYQKRVVWHGLGSARQRVYRAAVSDPIKIVLTDTLLEVRGGKL